MKLQVTKANGKQMCRYQLCSRNPDYISKTGRIKSGSTCVEIRLDSAAGYNSSYYCRECIDKIYIEMKKVLNPDLWIFQ